MPARTIVTMLFLLQAVFSFAQRSYDTLYEYNTYYGSDMTEKLSLKEICKYNEKGKLLSITGYYTSPYMYDYMYLYTYASNDSIRTRTFKWIPDRFTTWKTNEVREYIYDGSRLREIRIVDSATDESSRRYNQDEAERRKSKFPGSEPTDPTGWTKTHAHKFMYDDQNRVIRQEYYRNINDSYSSAIWTYIYDAKDLPGVTVGTDEYEEVWSGYYFLYKGGLLLKYREGEYGLGRLKIKTDEYTYNRDGKLEKIFTSHEVRDRDMKSKKVVFKTKAKERVHHKQYYEYSNGLLSSLKDESLIATTVNKRTVLDALAAIRTSSSTIRYGDVERRTVTTTIEPTGTTEVTKYSWESLLTTYKYDASGKLIEQKAGGSVTSYTYDSKNRLIETKTENQFDVTIDVSKKTQLKWSRTVYVYRK